ncbi:MAG: alpha/beta fold hydrolase [Pseudomonadales bacterium]|nr:alpha/beta fold hydrolase [Pseudomonadales bacterium]
MNPAATISILPRGGPLFFGTGQDTPLFGWFHAAPARAPGAQLGVLICNPFGFEEVAAHRGIRALAALFAAQGLPCLRFDYIGCGNSASDADSGNAFAAWLESVGQAIDALRRLAGVDQVVLVGFRLGATLAALAGGGRSDVLGLAAVAPVVQGRRYLRELRVLSRGGPDVTDTTGATGAEGASIALEPDGFPLSRAACAAIEAVDLARDGTLPARILLVEDPARERESLGWVERAQAAGAPVARVVMGGYEALAGDPQTSVIPRDLFARIVDHVLTWRDAAAASPSSGRAPDEPRTAHPGDLVYRTCRELGDAARIVERIVAVPAQAVKLFAVMVQPVARDIAGDVVLLNAGAVRNIGPNRYWVALSRAWAARGYRVLRLDFSGLGESPVRPGGSEGDSYATHAVAELAAAIDFLRAEDGPARGVHLVGLCSGGFQALQGAIAGLPLRSATLINPLAFVREDLRDAATGAIASYEVVELYAQYRKRIMTRDFWIRLAGGGVDLATIRKVVARRIRFTGQLLRQRLGRLAGAQRCGDLRRDLETVLDQGVRLNFVFATDDPGRELLRRRLGRGLDRLQRLPGFQIALIPDADHTFTSSAARRRLTAVLDDLARS